MSRRDTGSRGLKGSLVLFAGASFASACLERHPGDTRQPRDECVKCHGGVLDPPLEAAPPFALSGETAVSARGVGAHQAHLTVSDWARPVLCAECHIVPGVTDAPGHMDSSYPAEVVFRGPARAFRAEPVFVAETGRCEATFCHGGSFVGGRPSGGTHAEPTWTAEDPAVSACTGCHGMPPPEPHPAETQCFQCHENIEPDHSFSQPELHVDGVVTFYLPRED